ncbi:MAG: ABC transporter ATP-binding protein [Hyphomicrobiales bacterium]|nr:ABC transporter ATP-binding protein [Hyphomicrobiales bacterium]MCY4048393.1 ABC transporter ATP-binding protein [Hyphomicrobiales bacterium]
MRNVCIEGYGEDGWKTIVEPISFQLKRGEVLGLIGESGAGKSTLGLSAMGFSRGGCRIREGEILFDGMDLRKASETKLRDLRGARIAYVAQSAAASFNPAYRLLDQFVEAPVLHGISNARDASDNAVRLYGEMNLPEPETIGFRYPHQVSGGQLQRAMIAMAMSCKPDLIIFDEPTTALDVTTQIQVLIAIRKAIESANAAAIYVTHDLAVVAQMADRIMVLRHGRLVEEGEARSLLAAPKQEYTRQLLNVRTERKDPAQVDREKDMVLRVRDVSARYGKGARVLENVSVDVARGETVAVVGESGSGKSTLARVITGLLPPYEGQVSFQGEELAGGFAERSKQDLRQLQMIYQMPDVALNPRQRIFEILGRPLGFYLGMEKGRRRERIGELLREVELPENYAERFPYELSGGEKQRICIARALAAEPRLIICDEVTSALDQLVSEDILKLLNRLQKTLGLSYLFITHDLATVKAVADRIVVMLQGRVVEQGEKDEMLKPPHHEYTELLLSSVPEMDPDWLDRVTTERTASGHLG